MSEKAFRLEEARQAINRVYRDETSEPEDILESLEQLADDIEMYALRLERKIPPDEEGDDGEDLEPE